MPFSALFARYRLLAFRALRRAVAWAEPRDLAVLTGRFDQGDVVWTAFRDAGVALVANRRFDEADLMLSRGLVAFPEDPGLLVAYAMSAHSAGRYATAVERWEAALRAGSDDPMCHPGLAANLRTLGQYDRAQQAIDEALRRTPDDLTAITEAARLAYVRDRATDALPLWRRAVAVPKAHPDWRQWHAQTLLRLGRLDEAEAALKSARAAHPDHAGLSGAQGALLSAREDWPAAITHWTAYRRRYPDDPTGWEQLGLAVQGSQLGAALDTPDAADVPIVAARIEVVDDEALRRVMLGFESIGADCEFGLVQRRFGAEPLGLLRFNNVNAKSLMLALDARFEGMGDPDLTTLIVSSSGEYYVTDLRWSLGMHTFLFAGQHEAKTLLPKMCRRVAFLKDKLIADLRAGEKVYVFKGDAIDLVGLRALHERLRAYGPIRLLHVRQASAPLPEQTVAAAPGGVIEIEPDLHVGFLSRMGNAQRDWNIAFDEWAQICRTIHDRRPAPVDVSLPVALS